MDTEKSLIALMPAEQPQPAREPWRRRLVSGLLHRERVMGQVVRFGLVGVVNTLIDYGVFNLLVGVFGAPILLANPISVSVSIVNSFLWNKHWTFSAGKSGKWAREATFFLVVSLTGLLVNTLGLWFFNWLTGADALWAVNLQKLAASIVSMAWNFLGYRFLVFGTRWRETKG